MQIHLIGIAGSGMSALSHLLVEKGHQVFGSDIKNFTSLHQRGITFFRGHEASHVRGKDLIVFSSAIPQNHVELVEARALGIPCIHRSQMLAELMEKKRSIAVSGMHGKTSTTGMIAKIAITAGLDPTIAVGGNFDFLSENARSGQGTWSIFEADESDGSLLSYHPEIAVITNLELEHMDYFKSLDHILKVFHQFASQVKTKVVINGDQHGCQVLRGIFPRDFMMAFGFEEFVDVQGRNIITLPWQSRFRVSFRGEDLGEFALPISGRHQISNALATIAVGLILGVKVDSLREALAHFHGADRRFQVQGQFRNVTFIDDYAHHPTEILATLESARLCFSGKILGIFQPHRYSRTLFFKEEFAKALLGFDHLIITDVYSGGEAPVEGVTGQLIYEELLKLGHTHVEYFPLLDEIREVVEKQALDYQAIITLGAGNMTSLGVQILENLKRKENLKIKGRIFEHEPLSKHTTFRLGGPADLWVEPLDLEELIKVQQWTRMKGFPLFVIGNGSNIIVRDGGIRGVVVRLSSPSFRKVEVVKNRLTVGTGLSLAEVIQHSLDLGLSGLENLKGIPGSIGGALHFNAGAFGSEIGDRIKEVWALNPDGSLVFLSRDQLQLGYRTSMGLRGKITLQATFDLIPSESRQMCEKIVGLKNKRALTYPKLPNAGCIFRNPEGDYAGQIIDQLGLKNFSHGSAQISSQHANFIVNTGNARASDVLALIEDVRNKVYETKKIKLENEVEVIGEE